MVHHPDNNQRVSRLFSRFRSFRAFASKKSSPFRRFRALPSAEIHPPAFDFDGLARELASGLSRREALRRFALGLAAGLLAECTDLLHGAWLAPAAAQPVSSAGSCSSAQANACLQAYRTSLTGALLSCMLPAGIGVTAPWAQAAQSLSCLGQAGSQSSQAQQACLGATAGCPAGSLCSNNACCPSGLVGCGSQCCGACCGSTCCAAGQTCCFSACVDTQSDTSHCGGCGRACGAGQTCGNGVCTGGGAGGGNPGGGQGSNGTGSGTQFTTPQECTQACSGCCATRVSPLFGRLSYQCNDGASADSCGSHGQTCKSCAIYESCISQTCCIADASHTRCCPDAKVCHATATVLTGGLCCETGCCDPDGGCISGDAAQACGHEGEACENCLNLGLNYDCLVGANGRQCCIPDSTGKQCCPTAQLCRSSGGGPVVCCDGPNSQCVNGSCQNQNKCIGTAPSNFTCCCADGTNCAWVDLQTGHLLSNGRDPGNGFIPTHCGSCGTGCAINAARVGGVCQCPGSGAVCPQSFPAGCPGSVFACCISPDPGRGAPEVCISHDVESVCLGG
jgi:hypothetical protein